MARCHLQVDGGTWPRWEIRGEERKITMRFYESPNHGPPGTDYYSCDMVSQKNRHLQEQVWCYKRTCLSSQGDYAEVRVEHANAILDCKKCYSRWHLLMHKAWQCWINEAAIWNRHTVEGLLQESSIRNLTEPIVNWCAGWFCCNHRTFTAHFHNLARSSKTSKMFSSPRQSETMQQA